MITWNVADYPITTTYIVSYIFNSKRFVRNHKSLREAILDFNALEQAGMKPSLHEK